MAIYLITANDWWDKPTYDSNDGFVVRAKSEKEARLLVQANARGDEDSSGWGNSECSNCERIDPNGPGQILLIDFHAG